MNSPLWTLRRTVATVGCYVLCVNAAPAIVLSWVGTGTNNDWSTLVNWEELGGGAPGVPPATGDALVFSGITRSTTDNDLTAGTEFSQIDFTNDVAGQNFRLLGNQIQLTGGIETTGLLDPSSGSITDRIQLDIELMSPSVFLRTGNSHHLRIDGVISGSGGLAINTGSADDGKVILYSDNTYEGGTLIEGGRVLLRANDALGTGLVTIEDRSSTNPRVELVVDGLDLDNDFQISNQGGAKTLLLTAATGALSGDWVLLDNNPKHARFAVKAGSVLTHSGIISGSGGLVLSRSSSGGTLVLAGDNTYTGDTYLEEGTLTIASDTALGTGALIIERRGVEPVLEITNGRTLANDIVIANRGSNKVIRLDEAGAATATLTGGIEILEKTFGNFDIMVGDADRLELAGVIQGSTNGGVTKGGAGLLRLTGDNLYTSKTQVLAGTLLIDGNSAETTGITTVANGATLGGDGTTGAALQVAGTLAPGSESIESFVAGSAVFSAGATLAMELDTAVNSDLLVLSSAVSTPATGGLSLDGIVNLTLDEGATAFALGSVVTLISYDGSWNNGLFSYAGTELANAAVFTTTLNTWRIDYDASMGGSNFSSDNNLTGAFVTLTAVPEPSAAGLIAGAAALLWVLRRPRR